MRYLWHLWFWLTLIPAGLAQPAYRTLADLPYYPDSLRQADAYLASQCVLDLYYPAGETGFATVVWFHGGGLTAGDKHIPDGLREQGVAVVAVKYRLSPQVASPAWIEDAAAAVAWVLGHIAAYGGDSSLVFVSGHSAGGYLASMVGLDRQWLARHGYAADQLAGLIPFSGHAITHFTVRQERGIPGTQPVIDALAPLYHVRADAPPLLLITGDRELELLGRYEENAYLMRMMRVAGHTETRLMELDGYGHDMVAPAVPLLLREMRRIQALRQQK